MLNPKGKDRTEERQGLVIGIRYLVVKLALHAGPGKGRFHSVPI